MWGELQETYVPLGETGTQYAPPARDYRHEDFETAKSTGASGATFEHGGGEAVTHLPLKKDKNTFDLVSSIVMLVFGFVPGFCCHLCWLWGFYYLTSRNWFAKIIGAIALILFTIFFNLVMLTLSLVVVAGFLSAIISGIVAIVRAKG